MPSKLPFIRLDVNVIGTNWPFSLHSPLSVKACCPVNRQLPIEPGSNTPDTVYWFVSTWPLVIKPFIEPAEPNIAIEPWPSLLDERVTSKDN